METIREYGKPPFKTVVIHGGPGAAGSVVPVAERLGEKFGVLEPLQDVDTVEGQIIELYDQLSPYTPPFILVGHSWGAMLALLFAAKYPEWVEQLILVGCPPLDAQYVDEIEPNRLKNLNESDAEAAKELLGRAGRGCVSTPDMEWLGELMEKADAYEKDESLRTPKVSVQPRIFYGVWRQATEMRKKGDFISLANDIKCGVSVIHGVFDPHPYKGTVDVLKNAGLNYELVLLDRCGHTPWEERYASEEFYSQLLKIIKAAPFNGNAAQLILKALS